MEIIYDLFCRNFWGWFHGLGGAVLYIILARFFRRGFSLFLVLFIAVVWEGAEVIKDDVVKIYGSHQRWLLDSIGDVLLAQAHATLFYFFGKKEK